MYEAHLTKLQVLFLFMFVNTKTIWIDFKWFSLLFFSEIFIILQVRLNKIALYTLPVVI